MDVRDAAPSPPPVPSSRRRGMFQFSLRTLLIVSVVIAILAGWIGRGFYLARLELINYETLQIQRDVTQSVLDEARQQILARLQPFSGSHVMSAGSSSSPNQWHVQMYRNGGPDAGGAVWRLEVRGMSRNGRIAPIVILNQGGLANAELIAALEAEYQRRGWEYATQRSEGSESTFRH